jgi:hypothetical protein
MLLGGEKGNVYRVLVGKPERAYLEDLGVDGRIILMWILEKYCGRI